MTLAAVFPPMPTPFADGEVDAKAVSANVARWIRAGLGGVVALGTNGEAALLDEDESDRVLGAARESVPRDRLLIAGTGRESTRATIAATRRAAALGADMVLVRTPSFFRSLMTARGPPPAFHGGRGCIPRPRAALQLSRADRRELHAGHDRAAGGAPEHRRRQGNRD